MNIFKSIMVLESNYLIGIPEHIIHLVLLYQLAHRVCTYHFQWQNHHSFGPSLPISSSSMEMYQLAHRVCTYHFQWQNHHSFGPSLPTSSSGMYVSFPVAKSKPTTTIVVSGSQTQIKINRQPTSLLGLILSLVVKPLTI